MISFTRAAVQEGARTLSGAYYTSEELYRAETERIFYDRWLCIGRAEQIPNPGDYMLVELGAESIIVLRDRAGAERAHFNVCRHRGCQLRAPEQPSAPRPGLASGVRPRAAGPGATGANQ